MPLSWAGHRVGLEPEFADDCDTCIGALPWNFTCYYGVRSAELQAKLHDAYLEDPLHAPRAAPPDKSAHVKGLAIDLELIVGGRTVWDYSHQGWKDLHAAVDAHPRLHGGWKFKSGPSDDDHVEKVAWQTYANWAAQLPAGV
jgi:hypothetical protein